MILYKFSNSAVTDDDNLKIKGVSIFSFFTPKSPRGDFLIYRYLKLPPWGGGG
jgi:hypothetical protein